MHARPSIRPACEGDVPRLEAIIAASARALGRGDYTSIQIEAALLGAWGVDTQLIRDGTYFVVESGGVMVACGGWSRRGTLFGGDLHGSRDAVALDPAKDPARIRAFFVHPGWARRGIGRALLAHCESEARAAGFRALELVATLPGVRLYRSCGFEDVSRIEHQLPGGIPIEFVAMRKRLRDSSTGASEEFTAGD